MKTQLKTRQQTCLAYLKINKNKQLTRRALFIQELQFANFHKFHNYESKVVSALSGRTVARCTCRVTILSECCKLYAQLMYNFSSG